jgi:hypothetical protein
LYLVIPLMQVEQLRPTLHWKRRPLRSSALLQR